MATPVYQRRMVGHVVQALLPAAPLADRHGPVGRPASPASAGQRLAQATVRRSASLRA